MVSMSTGAFAGMIVGIVIVCIAIGVFIGFKIAKHMFKKQMKENPPITEEQIRAMYAQMGRKPSESQIRQIMNNFKKSNDDKK